MIAEEDLKDCAEYFDTYFFYRNLNFGLHHFCVVVKKLTANEFEVFQFGNVQEAKDYYISRCVNHRE